MLWGFPFVPPSIGRKPGWLPLTALGTSGKFSLAPQGPTSGWQNSWGHWNPEKTSEHVERDGSLGPWALTSIFLPPYQGDLAS